ncbi:MAG: DUF1294 domain-containing protein [Bacteroidales bacterium]|nr:DUF1294 domain-containing protein [Candidatus Liminaster caballi]
MNLLFSNPRMLCVVIAYLVIVSLVTFIAYGIDKWKARRQRWRIPESALIWLAVAGGSIAALFAMRLFHHKTLHKKFTIGIPVILLAQLALTAYLIFGNAK